MDYTRFVALRGPMHDELEAQLERARRRPNDLSYDELETLAVRYRQVLHDHSLASARFPGTAAAARLRRLVLEATHWLHRDAGERLPSLRRFVTTDFPRAMTAAAPAIGVAAALFVVSALLGFAVVAVDPALAGLFLGEEAIDGLHRGTLWTDSIFAAAPAALLSGAIARNNLTVALTAFGGGALAGLGALYVASLNGVMLGSVLALVERFGLGGALLEFIAAHGPLEITLILVSAGAGLHLGRALVAADDRPRAAALRVAGREALLVLFGSLPWILLLGFVEGFVSPSNAVGWRAKLLLGLLLEAAFVLWATAPWLRALPSAEDGAA